ncbi:MAG: quinone-dependent dihydroorotate dehydrogenase, partial [Armatimonadota bacterium]
MSAAGLHRLLHHLPPEMSHGIAITALEAVGARPGLARFLRERYTFEAARLKTTCFGLRFDNPVGLAAGFDKNGRAAPALESLGFGFIEVGTVTPVPQPGNDGPRLARLPDAQALVNRLGFPSEGALAVAARLGRYHHAVPVGINLGKNKATPLERAVDDYVQALRVLYPCGDYFVVNISS